MKNAIVSFAIVLFISQPAFSENWPRYLGPNGNGIVEEDHSLRLDWQRNPPETVWTRQVGNGCSSFAIASGKALTLGNQDGNDTLWCFDVSDGSLSWKYSYEEPMAAKYYSGGPSSTPTIDGQRVYSLSKNGRLFCLDLETGSVLWEKDYRDDFQGRKSGWGWAASPVVYGDSLLIDPGAKDGALVALDKENGAIQWKAGGDEPGFSTPVFYRHEGRDAIAVFHKKALVGYDLEQPGDILFRFGWKTSYGANASNPHYSNGKFYLSSGYGSGYAVIDLGKSEPEILHRNRELILKMQTSLRIGDRIIAHYGGDGKPGDLVALDFNSGEILWTTDMPGDLGNVIAIGENLLVFTDSGHLILGKDEGDRFQESSRLHVLPGTSWAPPAFANGHLFLRNNLGDAICLNIGVQ